MAEQATVARPYARAAFEHARVRGAFEPWSRLLAVGAAIAATPGAAQLFSSPRLTTADLVGLIAGVAVAAGVAADDEARNFLELLAANHRLGLLGEIAAQFEALRADAENTLDVHVATARPLSAAQRGRLAAALAGRYGREVRIEEAVDGSLIGGAVVRAGDLVIDGSLAGRLQRLEQQIKQS